MKVKALYPNIDRFNNEVGDILEVADKYGEYIIELGFVEKVEEKKAPAKKPAPKSKAKE